MTKATHRRATNFNRRLAYSFRGLLIYHYGRKHDDTQEGMGLKAGRQAEREGGREDRAGERERGRHGHLKPLSPSSETHLLPKGHTHSNNATLSNSSQSVPLTEDSNI